MIPRFERILLLLSVMLAGGSGLVFAWMKHGMHSDDPFSIINHPWQPSILALHVLSAPALVFALGLITRDHILARAKDPRARRGRWSGILAAGVLLPMVATGYTLQILVDRKARDLLAWGHLGIGALFLGLYAAHCLLARTAGNGGRVQSSRPPRPQGGRP